MAMRNRYMITILSLAMMVGSCSKGTYNREGNETDVSEHIKALNTEDLLIGGSSNIYVYGDRLYIVDTKPNNRILYVFDTDNGKYLGSALKPGPSPYEITDPGAFGVNADSGDALMFDYGQNRIVTFNVDSVITDSKYGIQTLRSLEMSGFPDSYVYVNDSTGYGRLIIPDGKNSYRQTICRYNAITGEIKKFGTCKAIGEGNRSSVSVSPDGKMIVETCRTQDLIVMYDSDGNPIKEIRGDAFEPVADKTMSFYTGAVVTNRHILVSYAGKKVNEGFYGDHILVFDLEGNYLKTLNLGITIRKMAYSPSSDNLYISSPDSIQFGVLPLEKIEGFTR